MTEQDRLAAIEQGLRDVKSEVGATRNEVGEIKETVAGLKATVELLVEGRIRQNGTNSAPENSKIVLAAIEMARMAIAALVGFFAGKGGN